MDQIELLNATREIQRLSNENQQLQHENAILKQQLNVIDIATYKSWNWQQIVQWIVTIRNCQFKRYQHELMKNLQEEEVNGEDLCQIDEIDIKRWDVKKFGDIKQLRQDITKLVNDNYDNGIIKNEKNENQNNHIQKSDQIQNQNYNGKQQPIQEARQTLGGPNDKVLELHMVNTNSNLSEEENEVDDDHDNEDKQYQNEEYSYSASDAYYEHYAMAKQTSFYGLHPDVDQNKNENINEINEKKDNVDNQLQVNVVKNHINENEHEHPYNFDKRRRGEKSAVKIPHLPLAKSFHPEQDAIVEAPDDDETGNNGDEEEKKQGEEEHDDYAPDLDPKSMYDNDKIERTTPPILEQAVSVQKTLSMYAEVSDDEKSENEHGQNNRNVSLSQIAISPKSVNFGVRSLSDIQHIHINALNGNYNPIHVYSPINKHTHIHTDSNVSYGGAVDHDNFVPPPPDLKPPYFPNEYKEKANADALNLSLYNSSSMDSDIKEEYNGGGRDRQTSIHKPKNNGNTMKFRGYKQRSHAVNTPIIDQINKSKSEEFSHNGNNNNDINDKLPLQKAHTMNMDMESHENNKYKNNHHKIKRHQSQYHAPLPSKPNNNINKNSHYRSQTQQNNNGKINGQKSKIHPQQQQLQMNGNMNDNIKNQKSSLKSSAPHQFHV